MIDKRVGPLCDDAKVPNRIDMHKTSRSHLQYPVWQRVHPPSPHPPMFVRFAEGQRVRKKIHVNTVLRFGDVFNETWGSLFGKSGRRGTRALPFVWLAPVPSVRFLRGEGSNHKRRSSPVVRWYGAAAVTGGQRGHGCAFFFLQCLKARSRREPLLTSPMACTKLPKRHSSSSG